MTNLEKLAFESETLPKTNSRCFSPVFSSLTGVWYAVLPMIPAQVFCRALVGDEFVAKATSSATESQAVLLTPEIAE